MHLFVKAVSLSAEDAAHVVADDGGLGVPQPCAAHGKLCPVPTGPIHIFQAGFSCCQLSQQNPQRFIEDVIASPDEKHNASWRACVAFIQKFKPRFTLLENTRGITILG